MAMGNRMKRLGLAALTIATAMMVASPALAASNVVVESVSSCGSKVTVSVRNTGFMLSLATVRADAMVNGSQVSNSASVLLLPGQTATVGFKFGGTVSLVLGVGVYDDNNPM